MLALEGRHTTEADIFQAWGGKTQDEVMMPVWLVLLLHVIELLGFLGHNLQRSVCGGHLHQVEPVGTSRQLHLVGIALGVDNLHDVINLNVCEIAQLVRAGGKLTGRISHATKNDTQQECNKR